MTRLSVNVNKVATLRNTRTIGIPSVTRAARICLDAGAHGITVHPRPDQRHIRPGDVDDIVQLLREYPGAELNIEGNPFIDFLPIIRRARPTQCTLVPDATDAITSNQGWNVPREAQRLGPMIAELKSIGCRVSLFVDPDPSMMQPAKKLGAERVELFTEPYAVAFSRGDSATIEKYAQAAKAAADAGLDVNAGHDLNILNLPPLLARCPMIAEVSIGHALIADALEFGLAETVRMYLKACGATRRA